MSAPGDTPVGHMAAAGAECEVSAESQRKRSGDTVATSQRGLATPCEILITSSNLLIHPEKHTHTFPTGLKTNACGKRVGVDYEKGIRTKSLKRTRGPRRTLRFRG